MSNKLIVIIDDDPDDQFLLKEALENLQYRNLRFFNDASGVFHYLETTSDNPFLILCDINMPGISGLELRKHINEHEYIRRKSIPFVFFSTTATASQIIEAYDNTVQGFFVKGQTIKETHEILVDILRYWERCRHPNWPAST